MSDWACAEVSGKPYGLSTHRWRGRIKTKMGLAPTAQDRPEVRARSTFAWSYAGPVEHAARQWPAAPEKAAVEGVRQAGQSGERPGRTKAGFRRAKPQSSHGRLLPQRRRCWG